MPFTGSHLAAVLPFVRSGLPASALVIGSMAPDLPYYLPVPSEGSHTLTGLLGVDLALALVAFVAWQAFVGAAVVAFMPSPVHDRLAGYPIGLRACIATPRRFAAVVLALLLGGVTHLAWDLFTHAHGWVYSHVAWMRAAHGPLPGYQWVHALSELVAVTAIAVFCGRWWRSHPGTSAGDQPPLAVRVAAFALVALAAAAGAVHGAAAGTARGYPGEERVFFMITGAGSRGGLAVIVLAGAWWVFRSYRNSGRPNLAP